MRLEHPRGKFARSGDGKATLEYIGIDMSHADGGGKYLFELMWPRARNGKLVGKLIIGSATSRYADEYAHSQGVEHASAVKECEYLLYYIEKFGGTAVIKEFQFPWHLIKKSYIQNIQNYIFETFFKIDASYRNNKSDFDETTESNLFYPDKLNISPYELESKYHIKKSTDQVFDK